MAISFKCGGCAKQYTVKDELAGKRAQCKKCGSVMKVPQLPSDAEPDLRMEGVDPNHPSANTETVAGSLINTAMDTVAGRGGSVSGQSAAGRSASGRSVAGRSASGSHRAQQQPPEPVDEFGQPSLEALKHVAQSEHEAFDVNGGTDQVIRRERGPATRNRAPMEPFSFLITAVMLGVIAYAIWAYAAAPTTSKPYPADALTEAGKPWGVAAAKFGIFAAMAFVLIAPLVMGAWYAALKIINVRNPDGFYMRSLGIASIAVAMLALAYAGPLAALNGIGIGLALVAIGGCYAMLHFIHGQKPAVAGIATGLAAALGYGGILATLAVADMVQQPMQDTFEKQLASISKKKDDARIADLLEKKKAKEALDAAPKPEEVAAANDAVKDLQDQLDAFKTSLANKQQTREKVAAASDALASAIEAAKAKYPARTEFAAMATDLLAAKVQIESFPTASPSVELAEAPPAGADWSAKPGRREVSAFAFNLTPPLNGQLDFSAAASADAPLRWQIANSATTLTVEKFISPMPNQQRPWIAPAFVVNDAKGAAFAVAGDSNSVVEYGKINGLPAAKITTSDPAHPGSSAVIYTVHKGSTWLKCTISPATTGDDAMAAAQLSVRSLRERAAGEPVADPMPVADLIARYSTDPQGSGQIIDLIKSKPAAEEAVLKSIGFSPDEATVEKMAPLIIATGTEKSSTLLWKIAGSNCTSSDTARDTLRKLEPQKADDIAFSLLDLQSPNSTRSKKALSTLAYSDHDNARQADVSKALMAGLASGTVSVSGSDATIEAVLEKWFDDDIGKFLQKPLNAAGVAATRNPGELPSASAADSACPATNRKLAIRVLASSGKAKYAYEIAQLLLVDTDAATDALISMGAPAAEPEVLKLLNTMAKGHATVDTRKAVLRVLEDIGTKRCLPALQTMASQSGDPETVTRAKALYKKIKDSAAATGATPAAG